MDPEVQEVPIASDTPDVQEVPVVSDVVVVDDDDAAQHKDGPSASHEDPLEALEKSVENASENIASFASSIKNFTYEDQDSIYTQLNEIVKDLRDMEEKSKNVTALIPFEVIEYIDKGRNPELCTYQMLESCAEANNISRGKLQAMRSFRDALEAAMAEPEGKSEPSGSADAEPGKTDMAPPQVQKTGLQSVPVGNATTNGF